jgi:very-short-patch-repair endonuclease
MLLDGEEPLTLTRSEAEERFLTLIRKAQLPLPETNVSVTGYEVDFYWRPNGFVVEIDGFAFHSSAEMFESDRRRDAVLAASGVRVMRATWRQLTREPEALLVRLTQALAKAGPA